MLTRLGRGVDLITTSLAPSRTPSSDISTMMGSMPLGAPRWALKPRGFESEATDGSDGVGGPAEQEVSLLIEDEGTSIGIGCVDVETCSQSSENVRDVGDVWLLRAGRGEFGEEKNSSDSDSVRSGSSAARGDGATWGIAAATGDRGIV